MKQKWIFFTKQKYISIVTLLLSLFYVAEGQVTMRLNSWKYLADVRADLNQLFNYNQYEGARWGLGLQFTYPFRYDVSRLRDQQDGIRLKAYGAYGTFDKAFKGGASVGIAMAKFPLRSMGVSFSHDLDRAGSRQLGSYNIIQTYNNTSYVCSRYIGVDRLGMGIEQLHHRGNDIGILLRLSREDYRFDQNGLLYPGGEKGRMPCLKYTEGLVSVKYASGLTYRFLFGHVRSNEPNMKARAYATLVMQYAEKRTLKNSREDDLSLFLQGGLATKTAPFGRYFDLSGTAGSHYFFRNSFMTVFPNTFWSNAYLVGCAHYLWGRPLWKSKISNPQPFVQMSAMIGGLRGSNHNGMLVYSLRNETPVLPATTQQIADENVIALHAPTKGLLEPAVGIERILRVKWLEVGMACAYQLAPLRAEYRREGWKNNFAWMVMANLVLEYKMSK
ncbi:MAG: hypothetical protein SPJ13_02230 [Bacteroidales bacterium]|nr:hypothetical protein [Bacteroidales bacterium]